MRGPASGGVTRWGAVYVMSTSVAAPRQTSATSCGSAATAAEFARGRLDLVIVAWVWRSAPWCGGDDHAWSGVWGCQALRCGRRDQYLVRRAPADLADQLR